MHNKFTECMFMCEGTVGCFLLIVRAPASVSLVVYSIVLTHISWILVNVKSFSF